MQYVGVGIHQQYTGTVNKTKVEHTLKEYPHTEYTREFTGGVLEPQNLVPKLTAATKHVTDAGLVAVWSFKPSPEGVANGKWRPFIEQLASYIKTSKLTHRIQIIIWHEPENDFEDPQQFVSLFNTVHDWLTNINPLIVTMHAALSYHYRNGGKITDHTASAWKTKASLNTIDIYSGRTFPLTTILPEFSSFKRWLEYVVGDRMYGVTERGWSAPGATGAVRAATINREADWLRGTTIGRRCRLVIIWDTIGSEGDENLPISDNAGRDAIRYYMQKVNEPDPKPETEPVKTTDCPLCAGTGKVLANTNYTIIKSGT